MEPDVIAVLQGGIVNGRSATYDDRDAFGTLGGRARVEAAARLAKKFQNATVLATDAVNAKELEELDVAPTRILLDEPLQNNTRAGLETIAKHMRGTVYIISNEYHVPRIQAFWEMLSVPPVHCISAESVLIEHNPSFALEFEKIKQTSAYQERLEAEARGLAALQAGTYTPAQVEDKKER